jgi:UPF0148 protein
MSSELTKKAIDMLLKGATLVSEPCPYCKGVRVMKDGHALCVSCGKEPQNKDNDIKPDVKKSESTLNTLEKKLGILSQELKDEKNQEKQQEILKTINSLVEIIKKLKN